MSDFEETNLFAQQAANVRKSRWIVAAFVVFFAWLGFGGDAIVWIAAKRGAQVPWQPGFPLLGVAMTVIGIGLVMYVRRSGAQKVLWSAGAAELVDAKTDEEQRFRNVAEEMAIAAGVPMPKLWVVEDPDPNAFATGNDPLNSHVAVTSGLLAVLDRDELQAVVGHEYGHIKNYDTQLMTTLAALVGAVVLMRDGVGRAMRYGGFGGGGRRGRKKGADPIVLILLVVWVISWILAPLVINMLALWVSRKREFLADAMSAQFTRNPMALAKALEKINAAHAPTLSIKGGVAHMCIADPLGRKLTEREGRFADAFATHPSMSVRIARLKAMAFQSAKRAQSQGPSASGVAPTL
ncbi:MAG TPA: M48 family metallopeptidase [Gemmatimonadaceae bacterium]|nr:M48 family metallopeptidase [Gemmatimonadaceae bacterium]